MSHVKTPPYTLNQAVHMCQYIEELFAPDYHICLGGSCLHLGQSDKDMDIYIYPDSDQTLLGTDAKFIIERLMSVGAEIRNVWLGFRLERGYTNKPLVQIYLQGYPIDLFFITWGAIKDTSEGAIKDTSEDDVLDSEPPF